MQFRSYFWGDVTLSPAMERSLAMVIGGPTAADRGAALRHLLESDSQAARGVGLDQFTLLNVQARLGTLDLEEAVRTAARTAALRALAEPPLVPAAETGTHPGANHASAFYALWFLGTIPDASLLTRALAATRDAAVLELGIRAAGSSLRDDPQPHRPLLDLLLGIASDSASEPEVRDAALSALGECPTPEADSALLVGLADVDLDVSAAAGEILLERDRARHLDAVAARAAQWPSDAPHARIDVVRDLLDQPQLSRPS
jgi:hypothetical protein